MNEKQKIPKITTKEKVIFYNFVLSDLISQEKFLTSSVLSWTFSLSKHTIISKIFLQMQSPSLQMKRNLTITTRNIMYKLFHELQSKWGSFRKKQ